jgi:ABC-type oligopeptide transport system ATPase subunit
MAKLKDENLTVVGFFGQSGAGKSTIIKSIPSNIGGKGIIKKTDVIRGLFSKNPQSYRNPQEFISQKDEIFGKANPGSLISEMYTKYIRSQFQLMNDFSTEVFDAVRQDYSSKSIMLFDRCPMDFQVLTECGLDKLHDEFGGKYNSTHNLFRDLVKKTSITNTKNFFDIIFVVKPWVNENINILNDGVRDQYLSNHFTGDNWYNKLDGIDFGNTKVYYVDEALNTIESRVNFIANTLGKK